MARRAHGTVREHIVPVRFNASELAHLDALVAGSGASDRSDLIRSLVAKGRVPKPPPPKGPAAVDLHFVAQLRKIGTNLNQIARELNARVRQGVEPEEIQAIDRALARLAVAILKGPEATQAFVREGISALGADDVR